LTSDVCAETGDTEATRTSSSFSFGSAINPGLNSRDSLEIDSSQEQNLVPRRNWVAEAKVVVVTIN